jgi:hypothetical protein
LNLKASFDYIQWIHHEDLTNACYGTGNKIPLQGKRFVAHSLDEKKEKENEMKEILLKTKEINM